MGMTKVRRILGYKMTSDNLEFSRIQLRKLRMDLKILKMEIPKFVSLGDYYTFFTKEGQKCLEIHEGKDNRYSKRVYAILEFLKRTSHCDDLGNYSDNNVQQIMNKYDEGTRFINAIGNIKW